MIGLVVLGAVLAVGAMQCGFWCAIWALREARGRPVFREAGEKTAPEDELFESLMGY